MIADSGVSFSLGLGFTLCLCCGLIAWLALLCEQVQSAAQDQAMAAARKQAAEQEFNSRYYPLVESYRFHFPRFYWLQHGFWWSPPTLPSPAPEILPTLEFAPKTPLYPPGLRDEERSE